MPHALASRRTLAAAAPVVFVGLWSTGFIGAKFGLPYAEPFTFLALRFAVVCALLLPIVWLGKARWPHHAGELGHIAVSGTLVHGVYLGGVFAAIHQGIGAGTAAVIVGAQPLLTATLAGPLLGDTITRRQWLGLAIGFAGVTLVVWHKIALATAGAAGLAFAVAALLGITLGTLYQKRFCADMSLRSGSLVQYAAAGLLMLLLSASFEHAPIVWSAQFVLALGWLVVVLSVGAVTLLWILIRRGAAARVASLFYLVPPLVAVLGYLCFDERLGAPALLGIALATLGVALVNR